MTSQIFNHGDVQQSATVFLDGAGGVGVVLLLFHVRFVCHLSSVISIRANICPVDVCFKI